MFRIVFYKFCITVYCFTFTFNKPILLPIHQLYHVLHLLVTHLVPKGCQELFQVFHCEEAIPVFVKHSKENYYI